MTTVLSGTKREARNANDEDYVFVVQSSKGANIKNVDGDTVALSGNLADYNVKATGSGVLVTLKTDGLTGAELKAAKQFKLNITLQKANEKKGIDAGELKLVFADGAVDLVRDGKSIEVAADGTALSKQAKALTDLSSKLDAGTTYDDVTVEEPTDPVDPEEPVAGQTFTLTSDIDEATANVFNSKPAYTPGGNDFVNTLQDEDILTGEGVNPTLNVTLGSVNDRAEGMITPVLNGIETVNVEVTGNAGGINFQDATGLTTLNLNRFTSVNGEARFEDLDSTVTTLSVNNAARGSDVHFHYREDVLTATDDTLALNLKDARAQWIHLSSDTDEGADDGFFFETINVTATGTNDIDDLTIQANGREDLEAGVAEDTTKQTLNIVAGAAAGAAGSLEINELDVEGVDKMSLVANQRVDIAADKAAALSDADGLGSADLEELTISGGSNVRIDGLGGQVGVFGDTQGLTVDASAMTGDLRVGVEGGTSKDDLFVLTSGTGNDEIRTFDDLGGDVSTQSGNDSISVDDGQGDMLATASVDAGEGNNTVVARDLLASADDEDEVDNAGYNDVQAGSIVTGSGNDSVTVRDLASSQDWDNKVLTDSNADDLYSIVGASISTGAGDDTVALRTVAEGASVDTGADNDTLNVSLDPLFANRSSFAPSAHTVLAADTDADQQTVKTSTAEGTREVTTGEVADRLGAVIDLGAGSADVANFAETESFGANVVTIVGRDAELRGAETVNVTALDRITVTTATSMADQDAVTAGVQNDINANVIGTQTLNLTIANQIDEDTAEATGLEQNDTFITNTNAVITADVMRFDAALEEINLVSQEQTLLLDPATEEYEAGTRTNFVLDNMREAVALSLQANEATGVVGGALQDDTLLAINATTGVVATNANAADVSLAINYDSARDLNDAAVLNVAASSGAFDLDLNIGATATDTLDTDGDGSGVGAGNSTSATDDDAMRIENFTVNFADANSHSIDANGFGDAAFRATRAPVVADDVSSTAETSFTVNSAAGAGQTIAIDAVNADTIAVNNVDGTAVTAANVILRVDASNNYTITTGSGSDVIDMRADDVRSDDVATVLDRADRINAGAGRDTLIVNGSDNLGVNDNIEGGTASTIIDDDVFATIRGVEKILVDANANANAGAESLDITLDEQAAITGVDTVALVGSDTQTLNLEVGNNFVLATTADNANGELTAAASALVVDASLHTGQTLLNVENKDDDTDVQLINMDVRVNSDGGAVLNIVNSGDQNGQYEVRVLTADENDGLTISSDNSGNNDGLVDINVTTGSFDKLTIVEGLNSDAGGAEAAMNIALDAGWTAAAFEVDASAVLDTDGNNDTGGAAITAALGDTAVLTISGTQNDDTIVGGRGADTINGNAGDDTITGDEVISQNELEVVTFAATYDAGDVITVSHGVQEESFTVLSDGTTGAQVAAFFAAQAWTSASASANGLQLRLTGNDAGVDYEVTAATDNTSDNVPQVQTLDVAEADGDGWTATIVWNGTTYTLTQDSAGVLTDDNDFAGDVATAGGLVTSTNDQIVIRGTTNGAAFPLVTQVTMSTDDAGSLALVNGDLGTDQANPGVVTETMARTVVGGADTINGGAGNDTIAGLTGADVLDGGEGVDTLDYSLSLGGVTVNLAANTASGGDAQGDVISNFEGVIGSAYNDTLTGSDVANNLVGGRGDDTLSGGAGNDTLEGGEGADTLIGGLGDDTIGLGDDAVEDVVVVASGSGFDTITNFTAGTDTIRFSDFADRDLVPTSLLQQTAAADDNADVSGANTELLVVTGNTVMQTANITAANVATVLGNAFNVSDAVGGLADGKVVFAIQIDTDGVAGSDSTVFGYYTDVGTDDSVAAGDIEIVGVADSLLTAGDFWLPTV